MRAGPLGVKLMNWEWPWSIIQSWERGSAPSSTSLCPVVHQVALFDLQAESRALLQSACSPKKPSAFLPVERHFNCTNWIQRWSLRVRYLFAKERWETDQKKKVYLRTYGKCLIMSSLSKAFKRHYSKRCWLDDWKHQCVCTICQPWNVPKTRKPVALYLFQTSRTQKIKNKMSSLSVSLFHDSRITLAKAIRFFTPFWQCFPLHFITLT